MGQLDNPKNWEDQLYNTKRIIFAIIVLFSILILPYLVVVFVEKATHNILSLGYIVLVSCLALH